MGDVGRSWNGRPLDRITVRVADKYGRLKVYKGWRELTFEDDGRRQERLDAMKRRMDRR